MRRIAVTMVLGWAGLVILGAMAIGGASALLADQALAAEPAAAAAPGDAASPSATAEKKPSSRRTKGEKPAKPRGRLPAYFSAVVTAELREKIYAIQAEYEPKISKLRQELDALTKDRDEKINALLSPEQKKKIEDLKAAARRPNDKKDAPDTKKERKQTKKAAKE